VGKQPDISGNLVMTIIAIATTNEIIALKNKLPARVNAYQKFLL
jgi:hypothetical protein